MGDHQVDLRDDPGLRHDRVADHVVGQPDLVGPRAHAHDHAVLGGAEQVDEPLQQADVGAAERAERQVDQAGTLGPLREASGITKSVVGLAHAGVDPVPGRAERPGVDVVQLLREDVQVGRLGGVDEVAVGQRRRALLLHPRVEPLPRLLVGAVELREERGPLRRVGGRVGRRRPAARRRPHSNGLHDTIRTNGAPEVTRAGKATTLSSTSTSGRCSAMIALSCGSAYIAPSMSAW